MTFKVDKKRITLLVTLLIISCLYMVPVLMMLLGSLKKSERGYPF